MIWLLDTGPLVAFFDRSDSHHLWARQMWSQAPLPMLTCDAVLAEATYLLHERAGLPPSAVLELLTRRILRSSFALDSEAAAVAGLLNKYRDQEMQLADACLVRMSELHRDCKVLTTDSDFRFYRRLSRQVIPLISPF